VQFAHQNLVIHRDLKPQNILITGDGVPKLLDFGIAEILGSGVSQEGRSMTPDFASPEQLLGQGVTTATDIYSLGVLLYLLLTGKLPRRGSVTLPSRAGREKLEHELGEDPEIRAELLTALGSVYNNLGLYFEARGLKEEGLKMRRLADPSDRTDLAADLNNLGRLHYDVGALDRAEDFFQQALDMWTRLGEENHVALVSRNLAATLTHQGRYEEALGLRRRNLGLQRRLHGPESTQEAASLYGMGALHRLQGEPGAAEPLLRRALEIYVHHLGTEHTKVASVESSLGRVLHALGRYVEAHSHLEKALELRRRLLGPNHAQVSGGQKNLAALLLDRGEIERAGELLARTLEAVQRSEWNQPGVRAGVESYWGAYLAALGRYAEARIRCHPPLGWVDDGGPRIRCHPPLGWVLGLEHLSAEYRKDALLAGGGSLLLAAGP